MTISGPEIRNIGAPMAGNVSLRASSSGKGIAGQILSSIGHNLHKQTSFNSHGFAPELAKSGFGDFVAETGISRSVINHRLEKPVEAGLLSKDGLRRGGYRPTEMVRDHYPVLLAHEECDLRLSMSPV
jgi:hypothetical protein